MNHTTNKTTITVSTATGKATIKTAIRKRIEFDAFGRSHVIEHVRGIRI